jgi:hypothetical protein
MEQRIQYAQNLSHLLYHALQTDVRSAAAHLGPVLRNMSCERGAEGEYIQWSQRISLGTSEVEASLLDAMEKTLRFTLMSLATKNGAFSSSPSSSSSSSSSSASVSAEEAEVEVIAAGYASLAAAVDGATAAATALCGLWDALLVQAPKGLCSLIDVAAILAAMVGEGKGAAERAAEAAYDTTTDVMLALTSPNWLRGANAFVRTVGTVAPLLLQHAALTLTPSTAQSRPFHDNADSGALPTLQDYKQRLGAAVDVSGCVAVVSSVFTDLFGMLFCLFLCCARQMFYAYIFVFCRQNARDAFIACSSDRRVFC